jgi:hypothetical protein
MAIMCAGSFFIALFYIFILKWITKPLLYMSLLIILFALLEHLFLCTNIHLIYQPIHNNGPMDLELEFGALLALT